MSTLDKHEIVRLLQQAQINPTRQRVDIAQLLLAQPQHLCAEQVMDALRREGRASASKATVYNTLNLFTRHGLLRAVNVDAAKVYFDSNTQHHHHLYNVDTGELLDVELDSIPAIGLPPLPEGVSTVGVDLIYRVKGGVR